MKTIKLTKDKVMSIRINSIVKDKLKKEGFSVQEFLDAKLAEMFETTTIVRVKK